MHKDTLFFQKTYSLTTNDFDLYDRLTPTAIFNLFQDIAGRHAEALGIGFLPLLKRGYYWVLTRNMYEVVLPLLTADDLIVSTWPHVPSGFDFTREYEIHDAQGNLLIKGLSKWLILSLDTHQIQRSRVVSYGDGKHLDRSNFCDSLSKLDAFDLIHTPTIYKTNIKYHQVDHNGHMNNVAYVTEITNAMKFSKEQHIQHFEINYLGEMYLDDPLEIRSARVNEGIAIEGYKDSTIKVRAFITLA